MHTTTIAEKLRARALEYEQKAHALRIAANEMNGQALDLKHAALASTIAAASKLRAAQKGEPESNGGGGSTPGKMTLKDRQAAREAIIIAWLDQHGGTARNPDIAAELARHGHVLSRDGVHRVIKTIPTIIARGTGYNAHWQLVPRVEPRVERRPRRKKASYTERKQASREKVEKLAIILKEAGKSLSTSELATAAREVGITSLTGIFGYVRQGYLKRTGKTKGNYRYSFLAMPDHDAGAPPAS